jgi:histidyl-tRNA synthetase
MSPPDEPFPNPPPLSPAAERPIGLVRGTRDWLPGDYARLASLERLLLDRFARAGYEPLRTPILEFTELHERKSGAGIVAKLFELSGAGLSGLCLRPELTASIVRAYAAASEPPLLPWRVSMSGPVFRYESAPQPGLLREFTQVGVELLGLPGIEGDAEVISLAVGSLHEAGIADAAIRIGHVGLILEMLRHSGLPPAATAALVETLSEAAAEGLDLRALEKTLDRLADWLRGGEDAEEVPSDRDRGADRLFRHLVPDVTGRRDGQEILARLRRKWDLSRSLHDVLGRLRAQIHALAELHGPAEVVLGRLDREYGSLAPHSVAELRGLVERLAHYGIDLDRVGLDLGFGRGIGFYSQMIFELVVPTIEGSVEVCGGGRYDGLVRVFGSDRDDHGVGFAFGLERLLHVFDIKR